MKKLTAGLLCAALGMTTIAVQEVYAADNRDMRAVWISTVYSADYPSTINNEDAQKNEFIQKLEQAQALGLNTVVVQVRPKGDAFYESEWNPWSAVLTGVQGMDPGYDPMAFMIQETHKRGMEFHAWMNPYRITTSGTDLAALSADNMARQHPDWILSYGGAMYYNPAKEEVQDYICDTVEEIAYACDGLGFDKREFIFALNVFEELGLVERSEGRLTVYRGVKAELNDSSIYRKVCLLQKLD